MRMKFYLRNKYFALTHVLENRLGLYRVARNFCGLAFFCVLWELIVAIRTDWFFCWELIFAIFRKYPVHSIASSNTMIIRFY